MRASTIPVAQLAERCLPGQPGPNQGSNYLPSTVNLTSAPFTAIVATGDFSDLPTVSLVVPNQQHDDHGITGGSSGNQLITDGDTWLSNNLGLYATWAKSITAS